MMFSDQAAVAMLNGPDTVRDSVLVSVTFEEPGIDALPIVTMIFAAGHGRTPRTIKLIFRDVAEFGFLYEAGKPRDVAMFKCLQTPDGDFYVSLDPYDESDRSPSEEDGDFVRAKNLEASIGVPMKPLA